MNSFKILYLYPEEFWGQSNLMVIFNRISNYLNMNINTSNKEIKEEFIDLRNESLPKFSLETNKEYREALKKKLQEKYNQFKFDLVAISCYSSFNYINTIEVANLIKKYVNANCFIVVGGIHPTLCPEDFQTGNFPNYIYNTYSKNFNPIDFLIKEEGEIPFFKLIQSLIDKNYNFQNNLENKCKILPTEILQDLNELPILNLDLFKSYGKKISNYKGVWLDFSRGCIFRCKYCPNSEKYINCYRNLRLKTIDKCIKELRIIEETNWLSIDYVFITDMIFLPKRSARDSFFKKLEEDISENGKFNFKIQIMDRVDVCSKEDLKNYKKFNMVPNIGLESGSETLLYRMGKILGKNKKDIQKGIQRYLKKTENIIKISNKIDLPIFFNYLIGVPGSDKETMKENEDFFLSERFNGKSLADKYHIILKFNKFLGYFGSELYNKADELYGTKYYYKKWWKIFDEDQVYYASLVNPSNNLTFKESINLSLNFIREFLKKQNKNGNPYYSLVNLLRWKEEGIQGYDLLNLIKSKRMSNLE